MLTCLLVQNASTEIDVKAQVREGKGREHEGKGREGKVRKEKVRHVIGNVEKEDKKKRG